MNLLTNLNRCINMTFTKYSAKDFLSKNYYYETSNIPINDLETTVINSIINLSANMPLKKVPGPVYVMYARKLEYTGFKYGSSLDDIYASGSKPSCNKNDDDCKKYSFISNFAKLDDIKNSNTSEFSFKYNYEIYILYPNLSVDKKYFTNYSSYVTTNEHIYNLLTDPYLYQVIYDQDQVDYQKSKRILIENLHINPNYIASINDSIKKFKKNNNKNTNTKFRDFNDILCGNGGCSSDYGEDLNNIFTAKNQPQNAYVPNKCLMQLNIDNKQKNNDINDINIGLNIITSNISAVNAIGNIYNSESFDNSNPVYEDLNTRYSQYPGIQEITFSCFQVNSYHNAINNYMLNLPWGNILLCKYYAITDNSNGYFTLNPEEILLSPNGNYFLYFNSSGQIGIYKRTYVSNFIHCQLYYALNDYLEVPLPINLTISNKSLIINTKTKNNITIPIGNSDATNSPYAIVLDNDGYIRMYGDYFTDITSENFINNINDYIKKAPNVSYMIYKDTKDGKVKII